MSWIITGSEKNPVDLFRSNVSLLLHGDGTNGSTTIVDSSPTPKTVTAVGDAQISTAQSKFGGASIAFDGNADYLLHNGSNTDFAFGANDFTIECFVRLDTTSTFQTILDFRPQGQGTGSSYLMLRYQGAIVFQSPNGAVLINGGALSTNIWYHVALAKSSGITKLFVDGTQVGLSYTDSNNYLGAAERPVIGGNGFQLGLTSLNGYIDELRITKGVARYTANFTPPTAPFPDI
jgi:hypothetical protein